MSKVVAVAQAVNENEELRAKLLSAQSAEERATLLRDHGLEVPTHDDVNEHLSNLDDVDGAGLLAGVAFVGAGWAGVGAVVAASAA